MLTNKKENEKVNIDNINILYKAFNYVYKDRRLYQRNIPNIYLNVFTYRYVSSHISLVFLWFNFKIFVIEMEGVQVHAVNGRYSSYNYRYTSLKYKSVVL